MKYHDDENVPMQVEPESPYIDKMREYVDIERAIERHEQEARQIEKRVGEMRAKQNSLRKSLDAYLNGDALIDPASA